ncbi:hypothetical protein DPMN_107981 [Dreissena polymorpha]|uniref:Uncharacterized protein n=1 Tax=Dreissena polymorpha TaxID=45954 RepID=A0A9D4K819_DREPO|nr:hypothetical protein DPMN_107981 [Dreissena polymorpha]
MGHVTAIAQSHLLYGFDAQNVEGSSYDVCCGLTEKYTPHVHLQYCPCKCQQQHGL